MKYYLGIDIGGTHIKGGIVNLLTNDIHQNILSHEELNATDSTSSIITKVRKVITDIQACMPLSKLGGIVHLFQFSSPYSRSFSVHFSFFTFFSDFVIFQVVKWMFIIFHDF